MGIEEEFLVAYAQHLDWKLTDPVEIMEKLCEEQLYNPEYNRDFMMIALGWMWAKTDYVNANCYTALLIVDIDKIYAKVKAENHW